MSARTELLALADRCELATGPDRELDCAIGVAIGRFVAEPPRYEGGDVRYREGNSWPGQGGDMLVPNYSRSIDAALESAPNPEVYGFFLGKGRTQKDEPLYGAIVTPLINGSSELGVGEHETSLPLAICAAALRARAELLPAGEA